MQIYDPLKSRIIEAVSKGEINPLFSARSKFGTQNDLSNLENEFNSLISEVSERRYIYIDLTPFMRIGRTKEIINVLKEFTEIRPVILINHRIEDIEFKLHIKETPIVLVIFDQYGNILSIEESPKFPNLKQLIEKDFPDPEEKKQKRIIEIIKSCNGFCSELALFRRLVTEQRLTNLICQPGFLDIPNSSYSPHEIQYLSGGFYKKTENGMLVSCFLNIKRIGHYKILLDLAYEVILILYNCFVFSKDSDEESNELDIDLIIVPSNSALFIASIIQIITDIKIIAIDKLGPIPDLHQDTNYLYTQLNGKSAVVFQEVIATGSETDRTIMFLNQMNVYISKIIALYNLDVGKVNMAKQNRIVSLCKPKEEIKYVYRSS